MFSVGDDVGLDELFRHTRSLGTVTARDEVANSYTVTGIGTGLVLQVDNTSNFELVPLGAAVTEFRRVTELTQDEIDLLLRNRLLNSMNLQFNQFVNSNPTLAKVQKLAALIEPFNFES